MESTAPCPIVPHVVALFQKPSLLPLAHLKTPISVIVQVLSALTEGVGINAATRLYGASKNSILTGLDHGVGHFVEMTSQKGLQSGNSLAIFSHDIHA